VSLERLWAGWRAAYVGSTGASAGDLAAGGAQPAVGTASGSADEGCVFCAIVASPAPDEERYVVWSDETTVAVLNAFPYASGHILVMPRRHVRELEEMTSDEGTRLWAAVHDGVVAVKGAYQPDGLNLGLNLGRAAGAGIPAHLHVHIVPRWLGDTNFMTATAEVRVLPEALGDSWQRLRATWAC
jgi:ATP adenylyltransferase